MNCRTARSLFSLHIDRYLSYEEERKRMQHLEDCTSCAAEYKGVERTVGWVRDLPEIAPSETFVQDVVLAAREARQRAEAPPTPGFGERIRAFLSSPSWARSPLVAPAALILGLAVGLGGTMLAFHGAGGGSPGDLTVAEPVGRLVGPTPPPPVGPFEDLVQQMLQRIESEDTEGEEIENVPDLEWGPPLNADITGRQVGTSSETRREREGGRRVTVVF
jgi:hypothetical protein